MSKLWKDKPPNRLWQIGNFPENRSKRLVVSIVGSRHCTEYGAGVAYKLAKELAERGVIIVSGMAYGIDTYAHRGCLDGGGETVAVLGTPISQLYPSSNASLASEIVANHGAIVSEYGPDAIVKRLNFVWRNRIVSGLADILVIVEASERSGTISTANYANDQGRNVFVVPGDIEREASLGANRLIQDGASIFTSIDDMLCSINSKWSKFRKKPETQEYSTELAPILKRLRWRHSTADKLAESLKIGIQDLLVRLSKLELAGAIKSDSAGNWYLVH